MTIAAMIALHTPTNTRVNRLAPCQAQKQRVRMGYTAAMMMLPSDTMR